MTVLNTLTSKEKHLSAVNAVGWLFMTSCGDVHAKMCKWKQSALTRTKIIAGMRAKFISIKIKSHT